MKLRILFLTLLFTLLSCAFPKKSAVHHQVLEVLDDPKTEFFYATDKIPEAMMTRIKEISQEGILYNEEFSMAEPVENFNESCVKDEKLLSRRLVFVAKKSNRYVLCYERGGRAHNLLISFSQIQSGRTSYYNLSFSGIAENEYSDIESIKSALNEERFIITYNNSKKTKRQFVPF